MARNSSPSTIEGVRGCHVFADASALGDSDVAHWLYAVVFDSRELWGEGGDPTVTVSVEAWERIYGPLEAPR